MKKIEFMRKPTIGNFKLIVLDEISMVDEYILNDLLSYKIKVLCCGDIAQLPAIVKANNLLDKPDYNLTQIMRQKGDSMILKIAQMAKDGIEIPYGNYGDVVVLREKSISKETLHAILLKSDQIICGTNKTRNNLNRYIRELKGIDTKKFPCPIDGEKLICVQNNYEIFLDHDKKYNLVNGTIGTVYMDMMSPGKGLGQINFQPDFLDEMSKDIVIDPYIFTEGEFKYDAGERALSFPDGTYSVRSKGIKKEGLSQEELQKKVSELISARLSANGEVAINRFEYAYAISCHKSQGSEWNNIVIYDESKIFRENSRKWLYTAITRARRKIVIIR
jgi:exodeoxyribonuclease-5